MAEVSLLEKVKSMIGVTGTYQDATIQGYIDEVKQYLIDGGVSKEVADASTSAGIIARGVTDLWNYGAGDGQLSPYFKERVIQLALKKSSGTTTPPEQEEEQIDYKALAERLLVEVEKKNV